MDMKSSPKLLIVVPVLMLSLVIFHTGWCYTQTGILPYRIVNREFQKKGGTIEPLRPPMYTLQTVKVVIKAGESDYEGIKRTLAAVIERLRNEDKPDAITVWAYRSEREVMAGGMYTLGMADWWPAGHSLSYDNRRNVENKNRHVLKIDVPEYRMPAAPQSDSKLNGSKKLNELNGFLDFEWGISKQEALRKAKALYRDVESDASGIQVCIEKMPDGRLVEWFGLKFERKKLASVRHRFNNVKRKPPFADRIIERISRRYGPPTVDRWNKRLHIRRWEGEKTIIEAQNQASEWYVEVYFRSRKQVAKAFSQNMKSRIWDYYIPAEDRLGQDRALQETAKRFSIPEDDVMNVIVEGVEKGWPIE